MALVELCYGMLDFHQIQGLLIDQASVLVTAATSVWNGKQKKKYIKKDNAKNKRQRPSGWIGSPSSISVHLIASPVPHQTLQLPYKISLFPNKCFFSCSVSGLWVALLSGRPNTLECFSREWKPEEGFLLRYHFGWIISISPARYTQINKYKLASHFTVGKIEKLQEKEKKKGPQRFRLFRNELNP